MVPCMQSLSVLYPVVPLAAKTSTMRWLLTIHLSAGTMRLEEFLAKIDELTEASLLGAWEAYCPVHEVG